MRYLLFLAAWMSGLNTIPLYAAELLGKVGAVTDKEITVVTTSTVAPRIGDPVEVFVEVSGVGAANVGSGRVLAVNNGLITATIERATGKIAFGQHVRVLLNNSVPASSAAASQVAPNVVVSPRDVNPAALGFALRNVDQATAELLELPTAQGCVVMAVSTGSPAESAGLKKRDVVRKAGGAPITRVADLETALATAKGALKLDVWRDGAMQSVEIATADSAAVPKEAASQDLPQDVRGLARAAPAATAAPTQDLSQAARRARHAVILFVAGDKDTIGMGSGFVISRKHRLVVTNAHVADLFAIYGSMSAFINDVGTEHRVDRVWYHPGVLRIIDGDGEGIVRMMDPQAGDIHLECADLAIVRLSDEGPELPAEMALAGPQDIEELLGKPIGLLGFPGSDTKLTDDDLDRPQATYHHGVVSRMTDFRMKNAVPNNFRQLLQHTASGVLGASGSPLFLADGRVVGVHSALRVEATEIYREQTSHGIRIDALWELLAYHKLDEKVPLPVDRTTLNTARFDKPDPEIEKFQKVWNLLGDAEDLVAKGEFAEAGNRCNDAIELAPDYPYCYRMRYQVFSGYAVKFQKILPPKKLLEQTELAEEDAAKLYELNMGSDSVLNHAEAINNVGVAAQKAGQSEKAERSHLRAAEMCRILLEGIELDAASQARAYSIRAKAASEMRDYKQAVVEISEAIRLQPNESFYYDQRAEQYSSLNDRARAQADRAKSLELLRQQGR
jgi:S1-C subfamily serine protease